MCPTENGEVDGVNGSANGAMNGNADDYTAIETKHKYNSRD